MRFYLEQEVYKDERGFSKVRISAIDFETNEIIMKREAKNDSISILKATNDIFDELEGDNWEFVNHYKKI